MMTAAVAVVVLVAVVRTAGYKTHVSNADACVISKSAKRKALLHVITNGTKHNKKCFLFDYALTVAI